MTQLTKTEKRVEFELIRSLAIAAVVFIHVASPVVNNFGQSSTFSWFIISYIDALMRWCVPVFIMVSGALVLAKDEPPRQFYRKRIGRIGWPLLFWLGAYWVFVYIFANLPARTIPGLIGVLLWNQPYAHLYFLFIMLELALITPPLRSVVRSLTRRSLALLIGLFLFIGMAYQTKTTFVLHLFIPFIGYYLYGYLFRDYELKTRRTKQLVIAVILATAAVTVFLRYLIIERLLVLPGIVNSLDILAYLSPTVVLMSLLIFPLLKDAAVLRRVMKLVNKKWIILLGESSFGIYLIHPILQLLQGIIFPHLEQLQMNHTIPITIGLWAGVMLLSLLIVVGLKRIPLIRKTL